MLGPKTAVGTVQTHQMELLLADSQDVQNIDQ